MGFELQPSAVPRVDDALCTACALCAEVCPTGTLALEQGRVRIAARSFMGCIGCGQCMAVCAADAVRVTGRRLDPSDMVSLSAPAPERDAWEALDAIALARRSVRRFAPRPVERELLERILSLASTAPMGIPPTEVGVVVFDSPEKVHALAADAAIAATYAMLAAQALGLGSCMIGTTAGFDHDRALKRKYGIPAENKLGLALILGHPAVSYSRSLRRQWAGVHWA